MPRLGKIVYVDFMDLILDRKEILADLHKISAHFGLKLSAPEIVASTDDDNDKIHLMLQATLMELLKRNFFQQKSLYGVHLLV